MNDVSQIHTALFKSLSAAPHLKEKDSPHYYSLCTEHAGFPDLTLAYSDAAFDESECTDFVNAVYAKEASSKIIIKSSNLALGAQLQQVGFRPIAKWEGMALLLHERLPVDLRQFTIENVAHPSAFKDWENVVQSVFGWEKGMEWEGLKSNNACSLYLAYENGKPLSAALSYLDGAIMGLFFIATLPEARGRGCAKATIATAINEGIQKGACKCVLQATAEGLALYRSLGFKSLGSFTIYWKPHKQFL